MKWIILAIILAVIAASYFICGRGSSPGSGGVVKITSYPIGTSGNYCRYKVDALLGKDGAPGDTGSSTYKKNEQICLLCTSGQSVCNDSITIEDPLGRRYGVSLVVGSASVVTCGTCTGADTRKIQRK
jgi:hypothetical protein